MKSKEDIIRALEFSIKVFNSVPITGSNAMRNYSCAVANVEITLEELKRELVQDKKALAETDGKGSVSS